MPNNNHKYGFRYHSSVYGNTPKFLVKHVATAQNDVDDAANSVNINVGDPLKLVNTGGMKIALTTEAVAFICVGIKRYYDGTRNRSGIYLPNATTWGTLESRRSLIYVLPASSAYWEIDCDVSAAAYDTKAEYEAFVGENTEHVVPGNTAVASADPMLDISEHANTATLGWRIEAVSETVENRYFDGEYVKMIVRVNLSNEAGWPASASLVAGV